jgi:hypothetical protein
VEYRSAEDNEVDYFQTPIHFLLCAYLSSAQLIQPFIDMCPEALSTTEDCGGFRPLELLGERNDVPFETVETLAA